MKMVGFYVYSLVVLVGATIVCVAINEGSYTLGLIGVIIFFLPEEMFS